VLLALAVGVWPRRPTLTQMAALGAAVLIALQLGVTYWFFLYVVWFFPLVIVALLGRHGEPTHEAAPHGRAGASAEAGRGGHEQLLDPVGAQR
jgi:fatty acid desaturase